MQLQQTTEIVGVLAHGVHYAIVTAGLLGLVALLAPQLVPGGRIPIRAGLADDHTRRVAALRRSLAQEHSGHVLVSSTVDRAPAAPPVPTPVRRPPRPLTLPLALVSSAAAAGIHAAVGPTHFEEGLLIGSFFAVSALAQLGWAAAGLLTPSRRLLLVAAVGNLAIVALWALTRTAGLPFGLTAGSEAAGPWDLAATGWELVTVAICLGLLTRTSHLAPDRGVRSWHPLARLWLLGALTVIVVLPFVGAGEA